MLSWLPRQRARMERMEVEAETMIRDFGPEAYFEARRREHEVQFRHNREGLGPDRAGGRPQGEQTRRRRPPSSTSKATRSSVDREPIAASPSYA